jgi:hypothetical protein
MTQNTQQEPAPKPAKTTQTRPNETGTVVVRGFVKIFDPNTQEKFVEKPA